MTDERISRDPRIMLGKPCIKGTRLTVELMLECVAHGMTIDEITEAYEHVSADDVRAALNYATRIVRLYGLNGLVEDPARMEEIRRRDAFWDDDDDGATVDQ